MADCEQAQMCKISLRSFPNAVIEHDLVTIRLRMDWLEKDGDDPSLLIYITNKYPQNTTFQRNQSSVTVNSVHRHHQYPPQDSHAVTHQQQYHHSSTVNTYDPSNVTTTTTVIYNSVQPQCQSSASLRAIQKLASDLKSQVTSSVPCQSSMVSSYISPQQVIQTPMNNLNDSQYDMNMYKMNLLSSTKDVSPIIDPNSDLLQFLDVPSSPLSLNNSNHRHVVCNCPNPFICHAPGCSINSKNNLEPNIDFISNPQYQLPMNQMNNQHVNSFSNMSTPGVTPLPPIKEVSNSSSFMSFSNSNSLKTMDASSSSFNSIPTILSQPPFLFDDTLTDQIHNSFSINNMNDLQQQSIDIPPMFFNNPLSCSHTTTIPIPTIKKPKTRRVRKTPIKRKSSTNSDQTSFKASNDDAQQIHSFNEPNSSIVDPLSISSDPVSNQNETTPVQDDLRSVDQPLQCESPYNSQPFSVQQSSSLVSLHVRSPVNIGGLVPKPINVDEMIDETINEVIQGKGSIHINDSPMSYTSSPLTQQQHKVRLSSQIVWEPNGPITKRRSCASPLNQESSPSIDDSNMSVLNESYPNPLNTPRIHPYSTGPIKPSTLRSINSSEKQALSNDTTLSTQKRQTKLKLEDQSETPIPSNSNEDVRSTSVSPIQLIQNVNDKTIPWTDTPMPSLSENVRTTPTEHFDQEPIRDSLKVPDIDSTNNINKRKNSDDERQLVIHPCEKIYAIDPVELSSSTMNNTFDSSTSPLPSQQLALPTPSETISTSTTSQELAEVTKERSTSLLLPCKAENTYIYDTFVANLSSSSSLRKGSSTNQTTTTSSNPQHNHSSHKKSSSILDKNFQDDIQSQVHPALYLARKSQSTNPMNNNDNAQKTLKSQTLSSNKINTVKNQSLKYSSKYSKLSEQKTRFNPIKKRTNSKPACTRCGLTQLVDITRHELPNQRGLVFECTRCGNGSIRSNVSPNERKNRLGKIALDHLNKIECQFCHTFFHSHNEYIIHLRDTHNSDKPMPIDTRQKSNTL